MKPPVKDNKEIQAPKGRQKVFSFTSSGLGMRLCRKLQLHFVFVIKTMVDSRKDTCPSHVKRLFCRPFGPVVERRGSSLSTKRHSYSQKLLLFEYRVNSPYLLLLSSKTCYRLPALPCAEKNWTAGFFGIWRMPGKMYVFFR